MSCEARYQDKFFVILFGRLPGLPGRGPAVCLLRCLTRFFRSLPFSLLYRIRLTVRIFRKRNIAQDGSGIRGILISIYPSGTPPFQGSNRTRLPI